MVSTFWFILDGDWPLPVLMKLNTESALIDKNNNNGMTLLGFKTILHKKCRSGKNSEGPAENSWALNVCPAK